MSNQTLLDKNTYKKYASLGVLFVCALGISLVGPQIALPQLSSEVGSINEGSSDHNSTGDVVAASDPQTQPQSLYIPSLDLQAQFGTTLGLRVNGEVEVPTEYEQVGWYKHSPVPGELGPAVVLGHVDSNDGPAVFFSLGQLNPGDEIVVERSDGKEVVFEVTMSERYSQDSFPTELVYGDIDHAGLRLVTCSGWYDRETDRYSHNRVVFAKLKQA